jgi:hypothetical protein
MLIQENWWERSTDNTPGSHFTVIDPELDRGFKVLCLAHVTNAMGQGWQDFEKGEATERRTH